MISKSDSIVPLHIFFQPMMEGFNLAAADFFFLMDLLLLRPSLFKAVCA